MGNVKLTVLTCTYNRADILVEWVYKSLSEQTDLDFEWLIIDDGSSDNTKIVIEQISKESPFKINYIYKKNGGKHTAVNYAHNYLEDGIVLIVDSDEYLDKNAIRIIKKDWEKWDEDEKVGAMVYRKGKDAYNPTGKAFPKDEYRSNQIEAVCNTQNGGEHFTVFRNSALKKYLFPVFDNEKFLSELHVWHYCSCDYDFIFYNKQIGIFCYRDDGLTKAGRISRLKNWQGAAYTASIKTDRRYLLKLRIRGMIAYAGYSFYGKKSIFKIFKDIKCAIWLKCCGIIPGIILGLYWRKKYSEK